MSHVTLVRHGQANTAARDEANYDRLSDLGRNQAKWLGEYFQGTGEVFARIYTGTMTRHIQTEEEIGAKCPIEVVRDARLNEMPYFDLAKLMEEQHGAKVPQDREEFIPHLPLMFDKWQKNELEGVSETCAEFEARTRDALLEIAAGEGRAMVVTSGGWIGMAMRLTMRLDLTAWAHACLAIENTSLHRIQPLSTGLVLTQFNALPHLDTSERAFARTHI
jgi:broad specificity phosphatase PhoE